MDKISGLVLVNICQFLDPPDIKNLQLVNKKINKLFSERVCKLIYYFNHPQQQIEQGAGVYKKLLNDHINASINVSKGECRTQVFTQFIKHNDRYMVVSSDTGIEVFDMLLNKKSIIQSQGACFEVEHLTSEHLVTSHDDEAGQRIVSVWGSKVGQRINAFECWRFLSPSPCEQYMPFLDKNENFKICHLKSDRVDEIVLSEEYKKLLLVFLYYSTPRYEDNAKFDQKTFFLWKRLNESTISMFIFNFDKKISKDILINYNEDFMFKAFFKSDDLLFFIPNTGASLYRWDLEKGMSIDRLNLQETQTETDIIWHHHLPEEKKLFIQFEDKIKIINLETGKIDRILEHGILTRPDTYVYHNRLITLANQGIRIWDMKTGVFVDGLDYENGILAHRILDHYLFLHSSEEDNRVCICDLRREKPLECLRKIPLNITLPERKKVYFMGMIQRHIVIAVEEQRSPKSAIHILNMDSGSCTKTIPLDQWLTPENNIPSLLSVFAKIALVNNSITISRTIKEKLATEMLHFGRVPEISLQNPSSTSSLLCNDKN